MTTYRVQHNRNNPYVQINKEFLGYPGLSYKAKGLLTYLLSLPDNWKICLPQLVKNSTDGESSVRSGLAELKRAGYLIKTALRDAHGRIVEWVTDVFETPQNPDVDNPHLGNLNGDYPHVENPHLDNPHVENKSLINNKRINNEKLNNEKNNLDLPLPPHGGHEQKSSDDFLKTALEQEPDQGDPVQTEISPEPCPKNQSSGLEKSSAAPPRTNVLGLPIASDLRRQQAIAASIIDSPFESVEQQDDFYSQVWEYVRATNPKLNPGQITGIAKATLTRVSANAPDAEDRRILRMWSTGELKNFKGAIYNPKAQSDELDKMRRASVVAKLKQQYAELGVTV